MDNLQTIEIILYRLRQIVCAANPDSQKTSKVMAGPTPPAMTMHVRNAPNASLAISVWATNRG
jgi:hypothetical protein